LREAPASSATIASAHEQRDRVRIEEAGLAIRLERRAARQRAPDGAADVGGVLELRRTTPGGQLAAHELKHVVAHHGRARRRGDERWSGFRSGFRFRRRCWLALPASDRQDDDLREHRLHAETLRVGDRVSSNERQRPRSLTLSGRAVAAKVTGLLSTGQNATGNALTSSGAPGLRTNRAQATYHYFVAYRVGP